MRYALSLVTLWLSFAGGAELPRKGGPWERDWAANAGDCVAVGEMPSGVTCKLYSHGSDGFEMRIYVYEERQSKYMGAEAFFEVAMRLCSSLGTPVKIAFHADKKLQKNIEVRPPRCEQSVVN